MRSVCVFRLDADPPRRFVEHFSPYCRHCRSFEPTWNDLVDHFEAMPDPGVNLAQVNCAINGGASSLARPLLPR